jgi:hypothetical protein
MNQGRFLPKVGRTRWTLALGLALGTAFVATLFAAKPVSGHEDSQALHAESAVHMHLVLGNRSVGDFFPSR